MALTVVSAAGARGMALSATGGISTLTSLTVSQSDQGGQTKTLTQVNVTGANGLPATGSIAIFEGNKELAGVVLNATGQATSNLTLPGGVHDLRAVYSGDSTHTASTSSLSTVQVGTTGTPSFTLALTPVAPSALPLVLTAGNAGTLNLTVEPVNPTALSAPMFVTLSCSGLPNQASCAFSPASVEILPTTPTSCASGSPANACPPVSSLVVQTQAAGTTGKLTPQAPYTKGSRPISWALLLPGALGLGGLAWGARRKAWLSRLALVALVALVTMLGTTACNPRYYYFNHGPPNNLPTPSGTFTVTVTGQSSNGITAITQNTTFVLTVN